MRDRRLAGGENPGDQHDETKVDQLAHFPCSNPFVDNDLADYSHILRRAVKAGIESMEVHNRCDTLAMLVESVVAPSRLATQAGD